MPRIFAGDQVRFFQDAQRAQRDIFQISDRRAHQIEARAGLAGTNRRRRRRGIVCHALRAHTASLTRCALARSVPSACYTFPPAIHKENSVPLYEYKCLKCGRKTEKIENVSGPHLKKCPHCGGKVEQLISASAIQFKGSGWYVTDYAGKKSGSDTHKDDKPAAESKDSAKIPARKIQPPKIRERRRRRRRNRRS